MHKLKREGKLVPVFFDLEADFLADFSPFAGVSPESFSFLTFFFNGGGDLIFSPSAVGGDGRDSSCN